MHNLLDINYNKLNIVDDWVLSGIGICNDPELCSKLQSIQCTKEDIIIFRNKRTSNHYRASIIPHLIMYKSRGHTNYC